MPTRHFLDFQQNDNFKEGIRIPLFCFYTITNLVLHPLKYHCDIRQYTKFGFFDINISMS